MWGYRACAVQAVVAVGHIEEWTWDVTSRFLLSSELIASCWREHAHQMGSQSQRTATYGLRRFVKRGSHFGGMLGHLRNIARNPAGDSFEDSEDVGDALEIVADPRHEAEDKLSDFYHTLTVEKPFFDEPNAAGSEDLTPDTDAGMAALQLQGGRLGRICTVVHTLLKSSLDSEIVSDSCACEEQQAPIATPVMVTAAATGYILADDSLDHAPAAAVAGPSDAAVGAGVLPVQVTDSGDDEEVILEAIVPRMPQLFGQGVGYMCPEASCSFRPSVAPDPTTVSCITVQNG